MEKLNNHISVEKLLSVLPESHQLNLIDNNVINRIEQTIHYVHPELEIRVENQSSPYIIISAPGAVGKTAFAKYASNIKKGYYWDVSSLKLGDNTFSGALLNAFGADKISEVLNNISSGRMTLFIDSFDEAEIISGWSGIEKFLTEMVKYTKTSNFSSIVMFSRSETALEIQMKLDEISGESSYSLYEIDYFSEEKAISFVQTRILKNLENNRKNESTHFNFLEPFGKAVKNIFTTIGIGINDNAPNLWEDKEIRCFLGYSPVLETIGDFMYEENYVELTKQFSSRQNIESGLKIIQEFIDRILERDQDKFISGLKEKVASNSEEEWNDWKSIYTNHDQIRFLLNYVAKKPLKENVNLSMPVWLEKEFTESLNHFIPNHPFIKDSKFSSPAFTDYVLAFLITEKTFEPTCLRLLNNGNFILTSLFAFFYRGFNDNICSANHVGFIYESVSSRANFDDNTFLTNVQQQHGVTTFEMTNTTGGKSFNISMECLIDNDNLITFYSKLLNATIEIESDIILGKKNGEIDLHNVEIKANKILVDAKTIFVNCHDGINSILISEEINNSDYSLEIIVKGSGELIVSIADPVIYPWAQYQREYDQHSIADYSEELYLLKRILEPFRKHGRDEFAKQYEFIDNEIVKNIPARKNLLEYLLKLGVIQKGDFKYYLYQDVSIQYGISWSGLKSLNYNDNLIQFFKEFKKSYSEA